MDFKQQLEEELKGLTDIQRREFGWRCAVRALPFLGSEGHFDFWNEADRQEYLYAIFKALDISAAFIFPIAIKIKSYIIENASKHAYTAGTDCYYAATNRAASTASYSAYSASASAAESEDTISNTINAAKNNNINIKPVILEDIKSISHKSKTELSLDLYGKVWDNFQQALKNVGCEYWIFRTILTPLNRPKIQS